MEVRYLHDLKVHNTYAAEIVVPQLISILNPKSVLDVGCGIGTWLSVFAKCNVPLIKGIDGDYINKELLSKFISSADFIAGDLTKPFEIKQRFDLVLSLEVAEHLPEFSAEGFIESLVKHGDKILFSAAIPCQEGQNHLNEQWPSYWIKKFEKHGYEVYDPIRPHIWNNSSIEPWYRQNMLLFSRQKLNLPKPFLLDVVLPDYWFMAHKQIANSKYKIKRIKEGKVGLGFYLKGLWKSLKYLGKKVK